MTEITKTIIPAAGLGTRLRPLTCTTPKELIKIGSRTMLGYTLEEAKKSRLKEVCVIINKEKTSIQAYLNNQGQDFGLEITVLFQSLPKGLAHAIALAEEWTEGKPVVLMLPDNLFFEKPSVPQLIREFKHDDLHTCLLALIKIKRGEEKLFGNAGRVTCNPVTSNISRILQFHSKGQNHFDLQEKDWFYKSTGRSILTRDFFNAFRSIEWDYQKEMDDSIVFQKMLQDKIPFHGVHLKDTKCFDVGNLNGLTAARDFINRSLELPVTIR